MRSGSGAWIRTKVPSFKGWCLRPLDYAASACLERARGVEPRPAGWKPAALPLSYTRGVGWWTADEWTPTPTLHCRVSACSGGDSHRQNPPPRIQHCLKQPRRAARAWIIAAELLGQLLAAAHGAITAFDPRLRREALASLARDLESTRLLRQSVSWHTSCAGD